MHAVSDLYIKLSGYKIMKFQNTLGESLSGYLLVCLNVYAYGYWLVYVNLTQAKVIWEESASIEKMPP